ncbi:MAG: aminoglycoside 6-adenylyltransferase [Enterococcus sp.]
MKRRSEGEMNELIIQVAKAQSEVVAIGMNGSRANPHAPKDIFQDFDIVYVVKDMERLVKERDWLDQFGERLLMQVPTDMELFETNSKDERVTFLMLFTDGNRIDLTLCPYSEVDHWLSEDRIIKILDDPHQFLPKIWPPTDKDYWIKTPTKKLFADCCNEFFWVSTYVVKGLCRQEFLYAQDHLFSNCQMELLRLLSWQIGEKRHYNLNLGKSYKYLPNYLSEAENQQLLALRSFDSYESLWRSLIRTQEWFHQTAASYAFSRGFFYDGKTAEAIIEYTHEWYQKSKEQK